MTALDVVGEWVGAVNALDVRRVMARSAGDIEMGGPRGVTRGQPSVREWVERAKLHMETRRAFSSGDRVVLLQRVTWRDHQGLTIAEASIAHRFVVAGDRIAVVFRHETLDDALRAAGLTEADAIATSG